MPKHTSKEAFLSNLETLASTCKRYRLAKPSVSLYYNKKPYTARRLAYLLQSNKPLSDADIVKQKKTCTTSQCCNIEHLYTLRTYKLNANDEYAAIGQIKAQLAKK